MLLQIDHVRYRMLFDRRHGRIALALGLLLCLVGCNDPDERKTHYITVYLSQDVEIKEVLIDLDAKKPGVLVEHPEGVEVKHRPTKPRKTVSFHQLPIGTLALILLLSLPLLGSKLRWPETYSRPQYSF